MLKKSAINLLVLGMGIMLADNMALAGERSQIYKVPEDVKCQSASKELFSDDEETPISKKVTYCTDTKGQPLNGQMIKYYQGIALKRYPMKDGYLQGVGRVYYKDGKLKTALNYNKGVLHGFVLEFDHAKNGKFNGNITEKVPYVNGQKEGIATYYNDENISKIIYEKDKMQGAARIWDTKTKTKIYDLVFTDDKLVSATYYYDAQGECKEDCRQEHCKPQCDAGKLYKCVQKCQPLEGKTKEVKIFPWIIDGINAHCLSFQQRLTAEKNPITYTPDSECNKMWLLKNEKRVFAYLGQQPKSGTLVNDIKKTAGKTLDTNILKEEPVQNVKEPVVEEKANPKVKELENKEEKKVLSQKKPCEDLGLSGTYTIKENYQTENKETVCVAKKDKAENLLQYTDSRDFLKVWAPKKVCSKAEKVLNPENCEPQALLYKFRMGQREIKPEKYSYGIIAGVYAYLTETGKTETRKIPPLIIEGINQKCLVLQEVLNYSTCPVVATGSSKECNQMWRQQHREEIIDYIKSCRAESNQR